jgi:hypothetical protein
MVTVLYPGLRVNSIFWRVREVPLCYNPVIIRDQFSHQPVYFAQRRRYPLNRMQVESYVILSKVE